MQPQKRNRKPSVKLTEVPPVAAVPVTRTDPLDEPMTFRDLIDAIDNLCARIPGQNTGHHLMRSLPPEIRSLAKRRREEGDDARDCVPRRNVG
jgi:hypothetical protein